MKKLSLNLEALTVETFDPSLADAREDGTVFAYVSREYDGCMHTNEPCYAVSDTINWTACGSCQITCGYTCDDWSCVNSCQGTCEYPCTGLTACYYTCCSDPC